MRLGIGAKIGTWSTIMDRWQQQWIGAIAESFAALGANCKTRNAQHNWCHWYDIRGKYNLNAWLWKDHNDCRWKKVIFAKN